MLSSVLKLALSGEGKRLCGWLPPLVGGRDGSDKGCEGLGKKFAVMKPGIRRWSRVISGRRFQGECWETLSVDQIEVGWDIGRGSHC